MKVKILAILLLLPCATSCFTATGNTEGWAITALGTDLTGLDIAQVGMKADRIDNSTSLKMVTAEVRRMWTNYLIFAGIKYIADQYYSLEGAKVDSATSIKLDELKNANSVDMANIKLQELQIITP